MSRENKYNKDLDHDTSKTTFMFNKIQRYKYFITVLPFLPEL